jgi:hypothetical protein
MVTDALGRRVRAQRVDTGDDPLNCIGFTSSAPWNDDAKPAVAVHEHAVAVLVCPESPILRSTVSDGVEVAVAIVAELRDNVLVLVQITVHGRRDDLVLWPWGEREPFVGSIR